MKVEKTIHIGNDLQKFGGLKWAYSNVKTTRSLDEMDKPDRKSVQPNIRHRNFLLSD